MSVVVGEVRPGAYCDSVELMRLQRSLADLPGVEGAGVVMATAANRELLVAAGLEFEAGRGARSDDLLVVVRAAGEEAARAALARVDGLLAAREAAGSGDYRPRSLAAAAKLAPAARWVLVSVPGRHAAAVAREALEGGRHVFLFSDHVALADEIELKRLAAEKGLLVMGPDCGTAVVGGVGLGFANRVRPGPVGIVAASGTGLQAVAAALDARGVGVSHALGTGGRDLAREVGGATALQALDLLARDPATRTIVVVSKPPDPEVAARLLAAALATGKPVVVHLLGWAPPGRRLGTLHFATSLEEAAEVAAGLVDRAAPAVVAEPAFNPSAVSAGPDTPEPCRGTPCGCPPGWVPPVAQDPGGHPQGVPLQVAAGVGQVTAGQVTADGAVPALRGLFAGGTLAGEARRVLSALLGPVSSSLPSSSSSTEAGHAPPTHAVVDLGDDEYTAGRPHPMIDSTLRLQLLAHAAADPAVGVVLLDLVLGDGAHPDPAAELAPAVARALAVAQDEGRELEIVVAVVGTETDPQGLAAQEDTLRAAGATVFRGLAGAVEHCALALARPPEPADRIVPLADLEPPLAAINVGLELFATSLASQGAPCVQVDWRPPAGGDERLAAILARLKRG